MTDEKYPIGTQIRFVGEYEDCNDKIGKIVDIIHGAPLIYLPKSDCVSCFSTKEMPATVQCNWYNIELSLFKNQQLLFSFMEE